LKRSFLGIHCEKTDTFSYDSSICFPPADLPLLLMPEAKPALVASELDAALLKKLGVVERASLVAVFAIVVANLGAWLLAAGGRIPLAGWPLMNAEAALATLLSGLSLYLSGSRRNQRMRQVGPLPATVLVILCVLIFAEHLFHLSIGFDVPVPAQAAASLPFLARLSMQTAGGFALLGLAILFLRVQNRAAVFVADLLVCGLILFALTFASGQIIDTMRIFGPPVDEGVSAQATICLLLLTVVVFARKTRNGVLSVLAGRGAGSRVARALSPILLLLPYVRELIRAHLFNWRRMPPPYTTALIATLVMIVSMSLLLYLAWRINCMEVEIRALSLRDELTGLYNLRGFRVLAEQALRMAHRSGDSFSVVFIDLDDLKRTNDELGHQAGSQCLVEVAEILRATFRDADVLGRVGGDEFAVAGEFSGPAIGAAAKRLELLAARRSAKKGLKFGLGFSIGHVTARADTRESLDALLAKADRAMYQQKRRKKEFVN
jgi:diguanylate cyclase (GGDEF)-like protein